jgi:hypothetical protein
MTLEPSSSLSCSSKSAGYTEQTQSLLSHLSSRGVLYSESTQRLSRDQTIGGLAEDA